MCVPGCHAVLHERLNRRSFFKGSAALAKQRHEQRMSFTGLLTSAKH